MNKEALPDNTGLVATLHPYYYDNKGTFERDPISTAFVKDEDINKPYVQSCLQGGETEKFISMYETLKKNVEKDLSRNHIALWHDESHFNKYLMGHPYKLLDPGYAYQEGINLPFEKKIIHILKDLSLSRSLKECQCALQ